MKNMKLRGVIAALSGSLLMSFGTSVMADSTDDLVQTLMAKGVLTEEEGAQLLKGRDSEKAKKKDEIKAVFKDGIGFESGDKANAISINGRVQEDYRTYGQENEQDADTTDLRRAYLGVKGRLYNDYDFNVTGDFAQGNTKDGNSTNQLDVAYFGINWWDQAKFRFGQFDMPFGLEHLTSDLFIDFQERGLTDALVPGKERGGMIHGAPIKGTYYGLAVSTGRGKNETNKDKEVDGLDTIGRVTANFAEMMGNPDAVYHVGLDFSRGNLSQNQGTGNGTLAAGAFTAPSVTTEGRGITFFTPGKFSTALTNNDVERTRYGVEGAVAYGPVKFQSEYFKHNYDGTSSSGVHFDKDMDAWYAAVSWMVTGETFASTYKDGTWGRMKPNSDFIHPNASYGPGAWELSLRYSKFDANDFGVGSGPGAITAGASTTEANAWTAGVQWIINPNTRLIANYITTKFDDPLDVKNDDGTKDSTTDKEDAFTVRAQFDF
jgi:phosphate-selective porin OprO and OprP